MKLAVIDFYSLNFIYTNVLIMLVKSVSFRRMSINLEVLFS